MPISAFGIRRLIDANQRYMRTGLPMYIRTKNFTDSPATAELGFVFVPTASGAQVGTTDVLISPPPTISLVSMHSLAMAQQAGVELRAGARKVVISHTWVEQQQKLLGYATPQLVFNSPNVVGLVTDNLLLEIVQLIHKDVFGQYLEWILTCNTSEVSGS